jgi:hypothetical protein
METSLSQNCLARVIKFRESLSAKH